MSDQPTAIDPSAMRRRFLDGLVRRVAIDDELLERPGTSVLGREDRAGTGVVAAYWAERHLLLWADPAVVDRIAHLANPDRTLASAETNEALVAAGLVHEATADMRVLAGPPVAPSPLAEGYVHRLLRDDVPSDVALVRAFAERSDPVDVDEAGLEDMDHFSEAAIHVVATRDEPDRLVSYGSACEWDWDAAFADIGVLVDPEHRGAGLGRFAVAHTVVQLLEEGRIPLYRHGHHNLGSKGVAVGLGFEPATVLGYFTTPSADESPDGPAD